MKDAPAGIPGRRVDHLADLVVTKVVRNLFPPFPPVAGLTQQETLQSFIQGGESVLWCKLGDLAELFKREVVAEGRPSCQEVAGRGRESGQVKLHVSHSLSKLGVNSRTRAIIRARPRSPCVEE